MIETLPCVANLVSADLVDVEGAPITAGTVNFYLVALTGGNAGKWYKADGDTWSAVEAVAYAGSHIVNGHWVAAIPAGAWAEGVRYLKYARESGGLDISVSDEVLCRSPVATAAAVTAVQTAAERAGFATGRFWSGTTVGHAIDRLSVKLSSGASSDDDVYNGMWLLVNWSTGYVCRRRILDYDGSEKVAYFSPALPACIHTVDPVDICDLGAGWTAVEAAATAAASQAAIQGDGAPTIAEVLAGVLAVCGDGEMYVSTHTGGADNLRAVHDGAGLGGVTVRAYRKSEYDAGVYDCKGRAITGSDGRWLSLMYLSPGIYIFAFARPDKITAVKEAEVVGEE